MSAEFDFVIIGGGVVGSMIARWLSRYQVRTLLIEKEADICMGVTAANTAIVHAGYDPLPGSLKAKMNIAGNRMWDQLSAELDFPFERRGDYVVAIGDDELPALDTLNIQAKKNGVSGIKILSKDEVLVREKNISPEVSGALWASTGGICDPFAVNISAAENAVMNGVEIYLNTGFEDFIFSNDRIIGIKTNRGDFLSRWVINCAGLYADEVMHKANVRPDFVIKPRKGEYFVFDRADLTINNVLFPVPSEKGKGILVTTTLHGNTIIGPNANVIDDKQNTSTTEQGIQEIWEGAQRMVPGLNKGHIIAMFAGLRPYGNGPSRNPDLDYHHDYIIEIPEHPKGFVNLGGIESPGLTAAPAIAQEVVDLLTDAGEKLVEKKNWDPIRIARPRFREMDHEEQKRLVNKDANFGRIICRCENVTEGEILAEIRAPIPAQTYDAIKRRTWLGTGRCQGGFDMPRVVQILANELGKSPLEISKKDVNSKFLVRPTKQVNHQDDL